jgi:hypothetical protein
MRMQHFAAAIVAAAAFASAAPASAHHSPLAQFDLNNPVTVRGTLAKIDWSNPHAWIYVNVKGSDGKTQEWKIEAGSPLRMEKRGLEKGFFQPGSEVIIGGFGARDKTNTLAGWVVSFPARESAGQESSFALGR